MRTVSTPLKQKASHAAAEKRREKRKQGKHGIRKGKHTLKHSELVSPGHTCMSQWSVITCQRLQGQRTRQLTGKKEVCWARKKFLFSRGRSEDWQHIFLLCSLVFFFFLNTAKLLRACSIQSEENYECLKSHLSKTSFPELCSQPSVPKINHSW